MFPNGWPGKGLLVLTLAASGSFIQDGVVAFVGPSHPEAAAFLLVAAAAGILLLFGLWTPVAGIIAAISEFVIVLTGTDHMRDCILWMAFGVSIAMIGPGNWSIDALLFGRQRLDLH